MTIRESIYQNTPPFVLLRGIDLNRRLRNRLERETKAIAPFVRPGSLAVDVGAYDGLYTFEFARLGVTRTVAFEPHPLAAERLKRARLPKAIVHGVALSNKNGTMGLAVPAGKYGRAESHLTTNGGDFAVPVFTLDSYGLRDVSFVKIDVEGHELEVLEGAHETITRERPTMLIEVEQRHHPEPVGEVLGRIADLGYQGHFLDMVGDKDVWRPIFDFEPRIHQHAPEDRSPTLGDYYINNFLFSPV